MSAVRRLARLIGALAVVAATTALGVISSESGKIYSESETRRILGAGSKGYLVGDGPLWTPSVDVIRELELALPRFPTAHQPGPQETIGDFSEYKRQYFGITRHGTKKIYINAFCRSYWQRNPGWADHLVFVFDGGSCFFQLYYDPSEKRFEELHINGYA